MSADAGRQNPLLAKVLIGPADPEIVALEAEVRADGQLATKAQDLAAHRSGAVRVREHEPLELRVRRIGPDAAIVALRARMAVEVDGALVRGTFRYTRVWAREHGAWRVAGGHVAPAP